MAPDSDRTGKSRESSPNALGPAAEAPSIPGVTLEEEIGRGAHSVVYRGTRGGRTFAVKVQKSDVDDHNGSAALRFNREGSILACLRHAGLPAIVDIGEVRGRQYIVREFVRGRTLSELIREGPLPEAEIVVIASRLAGALAEVHCVGMVHCDVKPDNILVHEQDGARLIDFGFAVRATDERHRSEIAGTLLYAAPEQTGMLKRPLDGRSDLYALGVVLYECATGSAPFVSNDLGELIRLHAVAPPPDLRKRNPAISAGLAAVIGKLLAKDPDDRYQGRNGLLADLDRLEEISESLEAGQEPVTLGAADRASVGDLEAPLIGRDGEIEQLWRLSEQALLGSGSMMLIESEAGLGKSRMAIELMRRLRGPRQLALRGSCPDGNPLPFAPLREAIEILLQSRFARPEPDRRALEKRVRAAAGDAAPLLKRFSPLLAEVLGEVADLPGQESVQDQFYDALAHLFLRLARDADGAILVVEDAERLDDGSRQVLARLAAKIAEAPMLVLLTARTDSEEFEPVLAEMGSALTHRLTLAPLRDVAVARIVAQQLGDADAELDFAIRIAARCHGSPFAATEYVRSLLDAGLLRPTWGRWQLDEDGLRKLDLPSDVVQLVLHRLEGLDERTREILTAAAVIDARFDLDILTRMFDGEGEDDVQRAVAEGIRTRLLERSEAGRYAFVHSEVRASLLDALPLDARRSLHQRIAETLKRTGRTDSEHLYAVARHAASGEAEQQPAWVFEANLAAGLRALDEYAHEEAHSFLLVAQTNAERAGLEPPIEFEEAIGEVCARTGRLADSIQHLEQIIARTENPLERARLRSQLTQTQCANFYFEPAQREAEAGFKELGMSFFRWLPLRLLACLYYWLRGFLAIHLFALRPKPGPRRERLAVFCRLCEYTAVATYFDNRPLGLLQAVLKSRWAGARLGPSPELAAALSQYAVVLAVGKLSGMARRTIDRAENIATKIGDRLVLARAQLYKGFVWHLCGSSVEAEAMARKSLEEHGEFLDGMHYVDACGDLVFNLMLRGYYRDAWSWIERQLPRLWFTVGEVRAKQGNPWAGSVLAGLGRTTEGLEYERNMLALCEEAPRTEHYRWAEMLAYRVQFYLEQGETGEVVDDALEERRALGISPLLDTFHLRGFYVFQAYARMEQAMRAEAGDRFPHVRRLRRAFKELRRAVMIPSMRAHALAIEAALRRLQGRHGKARRLLGRAEHYARDIDSPWVLYEVARQRAHLLHEMGKRAACLREARIALGHALEHGWVYRARKLRNEFGIGDSSRRSPTSLSASSPDNLSAITIRETSHAGSLRLKRQLDALLQVSLAAASSLDPDEQARKALDEIVRILGAERAFLFRCAETGQALDYQVGRDADRNDLVRPTQYSATVVDMVRRRRKPLVISGSDEGAALGSESIVRHDLRSILAAPLMVRERIAGVIYLDNRLARGVFTEEDVEILLAIGNHIGISLETARAAQLEIRVEAEAEKRRLAESLSEMTHALSSSLKLEDVLDRLLHGVTDVLDHHRASIYILEEDTLQRVRVVGEAAASAVPQFSVPLVRDPLLGEVARTRRPVIVRDTRRDGRVIEHAEPLLGCFIGVPLISQDRVAGVLVLEHEKIGAYTASEAEVAFTFAGQAGIAIENARLFGEVRRLATTDELTSIFNRRHFFTLAEREFSRSRRYGSPLSAIMLDVDHFKKVNDTYGHAVGDEVLKAIAARCQSCIRDLDVLGRYGGEEFAIVLPGTVLEQARDHLAERLRQTIADTPVTTARGELDLTVSIGVAQVTGTTKDLAALIDRADGALYRAKEEGRNRVIASEGEPEC